MAKEAGPEGARRREDPLRRSRAGGGRLLLRRLDRRRARRLRDRPHRRADLQRQQQLLDGFDGALHGQAVRRGRASPTARWRSASRRWRRAPSASSTPIAPCPMDKHMKVMVEMRGFAKAPAAPQMFGNAGREHMEKYGTKPEVFAKIGYKNHKHSVNNPYSQFQDEYSLEDILNAPMVYEPLTKLQCCPTSDGSGAAILASEDFVREAQPEGPGGRDRRHGDGDRHAQHLRREELHQDGRLRHVAEGGAQGLRAGGRRPGERAGDRAARLLQRQRADHLRGARPLRRSARPANSSTRAPPPTAASGS